MSRISDNEATKKLETLKNHGYWFWTPELMVENSDTSIQELIDTHEIFLKKLESSTPNKITSSLLNTSAPLTLTITLIQLMRATDGSAELLDRLKDYIIFKKLNHITIVYENHEIKYEFKSIGKTFTSNLNTENILKSDLQLAEDIITILLFGSDIIEFKKFITLKKLCLGKIIGNKSALSNYFNSLYLKVSRQSSGKSSAQSGRLPQEIVMQSLDKYLTHRNDILKVSNRRIQGIGSDPNGREFDLVYEIKKKKSDSIFIAIEIAFQETTNSVIERKSRDSVNLFPIFVKKHYHLCYVVDGAGYFSRKKALKDIIKYSHLCVTFKQLDELGEYIDKL